MENVHQLRVFAAVAQHLSFTKAAQMLFLTQSAASHQIAALEMEIGAPLFRREGRRISLTEAGRVLVVQCQRVFGAIEEAENAVKRAARPNTGSLRIGASPTACQHIIPEAIREFRESYPDFELSIVVADSPDLARQLVDGAIDLGLMIRGERDKRLTLHEIFTDDLGILVSPLHPWARAGKVDRREMLDQHFVLYARTSATFRFVERHLLRLQTPLRKFTELGSMEAIKELVKLGLGISVVAPWIAAPEIAQRSLVWLKMPGPQLRRNWCLGCRTGRRLMTAEQTFLGLCRTTAQNLDLGPLSSRNRASRHADG